VRLIGAVVFLLAA